MSKYKIECLYCGHTFSVELYSRKLAEHIHCTICGDKSTRLINDEKRNVFGYEDAHE